jgi:DNA-binding transcriptional MerR regulator
MYKVSAYRATIFRQTRANARGSVFRIIDQYQRVIENTPSVLELAVWPDLHKHCTIIIASALSGRKGQDRMKGQGRYRIRAVAELTGIPEATLRAWERRYSVPVPVRTASGYRLYSHMDVEQIRRMRELCTAGMSPVDAAKICASAPEVPRPATLQSDPFEIAATRIVEVTRRMDTLALAGEIRFAMTLADAPTIVERVFCPAMAEIGRDWERGIISIGHEHLASEVITAATRDMLRLLSPARPIGDVVLACFAEEDHTLPLYAAAFRFVEWGCRPHMLGARTPPAAVGAAVKEIGPALVGLSCTIAPPVDRAEELVAAYADALSGCAWAVGGAASESLRSLVESQGGHIISARGEEARRKLGVLLTGARGDGMLQS